MSMNGGSSSASSSSVTFRSLTPYLRGRWGSVALAGLLSLLGAGLALGQPLLTRAVIELLSAGRGVTALVALLVVVLVSAAVVTAVRDLVLQRTGEHVVRETRRRLARHMLRLPIAEYDDRRLGDLLSRLGADTTLLRAVVTSGLFDLATGAILVVGATVGMALIDWKLLAATLIGLAVVVAVGSISVRPIRKLSREAQSRVGDMTAAVERALTAIRTIRANRADDREAEVIGVHADAAAAAGMRLARHQALVGPLNSVALQFVLLLVLGFGGSQVAAGRMTVGSLVAFVLFLFYMSMPLAQAMHAYAQLQSGLAALERIEEVLRMPSERSGPGVEFVRDRLVVGPVQAAVEFDRVSFSYPDGPPVLRDVSFRVPAGTHTALVGPSAAGKSTMLMLIERFYDVGSGCVRVGGVDVRSLSFTDLRGQLGYVEQEASVLAGTLRDNLRLAAADADDEQMMRVLRRVRLEDVLRRSTHGLDTEVGEHGVRLSGGERQRLAIARSLLADQPILLLDEPTSNLDARNEARLRETIGRAAEGRTLIVVAHRLSTVVNADQIVVLDEGRVVDVGSHGELTDRSGLYRELARHQLLVA
ncbi:ABC transporter ATP-binding protein/permease [Micromonospora sp. BRA006-A]|uniref:ABC transporter ATP-binding protein n=1 Tax=Micromonospora sp. BRA006-A TaxID=2962860 RepID=UPI00296ED2B5|nr:ABC transporter ATP-binding protein [Micromonospora sp. BRA006-A]MDW3846696.1 ABC transporter ATP-binding protein/permease [Micromonospora sp. BRA006-A]